MGWRTVTNPVARAIESSASGGEGSRVGKINATVSSIEETALALDSLLTVAKVRQVELPAESDAMNRFKETRESLAADKENQQHPRSITEENQQYDVGSTKRSSSPSPELKDPTPQPIPTKGGTIVKVSAETIENKPASRITEESKGLEAQDAVTDALCESIIQGTNFLIDGLESGRHRVAWPIGFYFAKLWYHEKLYPYVFSASALGKFLGALVKSVGHKVANLIHYFDLPPYLFSPPTPHILRYLVCRAESPTASHHQILKTRRRVRADARRVI